MPRRLPSSKRGASAKSASITTSERINPRSFIVIGAGLAGLSAAHLLSQKNKIEEAWDVTVLEAQPWTGGRVYSFSFDEAPGLVCELGGEWIGKDHHSIIALCDSFKLNRIAHQFDFFFFEKGKRGQQYRAGDWPFSDSAREQFDHLDKQTQRWNQKQREILDRKDWWTILRDRGFDECDLLRRDLMDSTDFGESIRQAGGYSAASEYFQSDSTDEMDWKIAGGNHELVRALEKSIWSQDGRVLTARKVISIQQPESQPGVIVTTSLGETFRARYCICTVPARTLTKINFEPKLPGKQWDAAKQLQYCRIMKTAVLCETRFWMEHQETRFSCFSDLTSDFIFDATLGQPGTMGILCSYAIGDKADDLCGYTLPDLQTKMENDLKAIFPGKPVRVLRIKRQPWQHNEYSEGAYAFYRPGQWFPVRKILATHFKNVLFAGEHIAEEQGFMDGAIDTGQTAARTLIRHIGKLVHGKK